MIDRSTMNEHMLKAEINFDFLESTDEQCPHCGEKLIVIITAIWSVKNYNKPATTKALCCGNYINLIPITTLEIKKSEVRKCDWMGVDEEA